MTDGRTSGLDPNVFSAFWRLMRCTETHVRVAALFAILFCVICSMGLGGLVLPSLTDAINSWFGMEWSPDGLALWARITLAVVWVVPFSLAFMYLLLAGFWPLPLPTPRV